MKLLRLWFGLSATVTRRTYLLSGLGLMALKVLVDNGIAIAATGRPWSLWAYLAPSMALKANQAADVGPTPDWMLVAMVLVALPFVWIGVSMSVRRAADAGTSPFLGLLFLVPIVNWIAMIVLAALPSPASGSRWQGPPPGVYRTNVVPADAAPDSLPKREIDPGVKATLIGMLSSVAIGLGMIGVSIYSMKLYGAALFFATPFLMGVTTAFAYNFRAARGLPATIGLALLSVVVTGSVVLLFAIEGLICLAMAFPIAAVLSILGALVGWALAHQAGARPTHAMMSVLALPALAGAEHQIATPQLREVTTAIEIDAPPERVWPNVIGFSELPPPSELTFRLGIAYPMRARIDGEGVGAVRHCEFSTGPFVEPITIWEPPRRLAFDVTAQPPSMSELSPYKNVKAAHLEGYMTSKRGEFRLVPLPDGRTRLEGSTWYTLSIFPEDYWTIFGEALLHSIHGRVLGHIKSLSEAR
ncbi:MAG: DUF805 domain-containing protein [Labilithrix sp.]|nr:DUF805 domain-containing protein [Labilithrix sp.]